MSKQGLLNYIYTTLYYTSDLAAYGRCVSRCYNFIRMHSNIYALYPVATPYSELLFEFNHTYA